MKKFLVVGAAASILLSLFACARHEQQLQEKGIKVLKQSELEQLFKTERTATTTVPNGTFTVKYYPDGRQEVSYAQGTDTGNYRIQDDKFCSRWQKSRGGQEACCRFYKIGENKYEMVTNDGYFLGTIDFK